MIVQTFVAAFVIVAGDAGFVPVEFHASNQPSHETLELDPILYQLYRQRVHRASKVSDGAK